MEAMKYLLLVFVLWVSPADAVTQRSQAAKRAFVRAQACPATGLHKLPCPGYVIDHVKPLACGGADKKINMQWQTVADGKAKDRIERLGCVHG